MMKQILERDPNWSFSTKSSLFWRIHTLHPYGKDSVESGHAPVSNEKGGMQTPKAALNY